MKVLQKIKTRQDEAKQTHVQVLTRLDDSAVFVTFSEIFKNYLKLLFRQFTDLSRSNCLHYPFRLYLKIGFHNFSIFGPLQTRKPTLFVNVSNQNDEESSWLIKFVFFKQIERTPVFGMSNLRLRHDQFGGLRVRVWPDGSAPAIQSAAGLAVVRGSVGLLDVVPGGDEVGFGGSPERIRDSISALRFSLRCSSC